MERLFGLLGVLLVLSVMLTVPAWAQVTISVDETIDDDPVVDNGSCSLREAIIAANTNATVDTCTHNGSTGEDTIILTAATTYNVTINGALEDAAANGDLDLTDSNGLIIRSSIVGTQATVDGGEAFNNRIFEVRAGDATFQDLVIRDGTVSGAGGGINLPPLAVAGRNLTITRSTITSNDVGGGSSGDGAGIAVDYDLETSDATVTISESTIFDNTMAASSADNGGGIFIDGPTSGNFTVVVQNSLISNNTAADDGGGIYVTGSAVILQLSGSTISGNASQDSGQDGGGLKAISSAVVNIRNTTISGNSAQGDGGGIHNSTGDITILNSTLSGNTAGNGGGLAMSGGAGSIDVFNATISNNTGSTQGGGIFSTSGTLTLDNVTIADNEAGAVAGSGAGILGGGTVTLNNSILTGNLQDDDLTEADECTTGTFSGTNNLIDDTSCGATSPFRLGAIDGAAFNTTLAGNGGPTQTHEITSQTTSTDGVDDGTACGLATDQRGFSRTGNCDVGPLEANSNASPGVFINGTAGTGNDVGWRMVAAPCAGRDRGDLSFAGTITGNDEVRSFDESAGSGDAQWLDVGAADALAQGTGFIAYLYDDGSLTVGADFLFGFSGCSETTSDFTLTGLDVNEEFALAGNPFYTSFDLSSLNLGANGHQSTVQVWDPTAGGGTGSYRTLVQGADTDQIAMGQGFFVQRSSPGFGGTSLTFLAVGRTTGGGFIGKGNHAGWGRLGLRLVGTDVHGASVYDEAAELLFLDEGEMGWDVYEATKFIPLTGSFVTAAFVGEREGEAVARALASYPEALTTVLSIPLQIDGRGFTGTVTLSWPDVESLPADWALALIDHDLGEKVDLRTAVGYTFDYAAPAGKVAPAEVLAQPLAMAAATTRFDLVITPAGVTATEGTDVPAVFALEANYPNPFNPSTTIRYALPQAGSVRLIVYDVLGREVARVVDGRQSAGHHTVRFDGAHLSSGLYLYRLTTDNATTARTMLLLK